MNIQNTIKSQNTTRNLSVECVNALELIDRLALSDLSKHPQLKAHLRQCPMCAATHRLELGLRAVIAPAVLPAPSPNFEALLASQILPASFSTHAAAEPEFSRKAERASQWGWAISALTFAVLAASQMPKTFALVADIPNLLMRFYAYLASHLSGDSAVCFSHIRGLLEYTQADKLTLIMGIALLVTGITATRILLYREE